MKKRLHNFNPGPATLPLQVLEEAAGSMVEFQELGMSILEMSHRSKEYEKVNAETEKDMLDLMGLSDDYQVLFLGGGASLQFAMVPMNLLKEGMTADYVNTGTWAGRAIKEAKLLGKVNVAASSEDKKHTYIPGQFNWTKDAVYAHITTNNTIYGTQWHSIPDLSSGTPLIADMSSDILSHQMDFSRFSLIYAGAQKNLGPAGVTLIILKKSIFQKCRGDIPIIMRYETHAENKSLYNTPPVFAVYVVHLVLKWIKGQGGLKEVEKINRKKADHLYNAIDEMGDFYQPVVEKESRSWMNVVFRLPSEDLEKQFIEESKKEGLFGLKGHRSVGGMRASLYNAFPYEGVEKLVSFMKAFHKSHSLAKK